MANTTLGSLLIKLRADTSAFTKGMGDAKSLAFESSSDIVESLKRIGEQFTKLKFNNATQIKRDFEIVGGVMAGVAVGVTAATVAIAKDVAEQGKQMEKLAQSYGLSIESVSALRVAAKLTGVDMETLTMGMGRMARNMALVSAGGKDSNAGLQLLKTSMRDGAGNSKTMEETLGGVAEKLAKMPDGWQKTALAQQIFGKSAAALIPFLNQGKQGMEEFDKLSKQLGLTWTEKDVVAAEQLTRSIEILELKGQAFKEQYAKGVIPAMDTLANAFIVVDKNGQSLATTLGENMGSAFVFMAKRLNEVVALLRLFKAALSDAASAASSTMDNASKQPQWLSGLLPEVSFVEGLRKYDIETEGSKKDKIGQILEQYGSTAKALDTPWMAPPAKKRDGKTTDFGAGGVDLITERIAKLKAQTEAEGRLANAIGDTVSATVLATAAAEAQKTIDELNAEGKKKGISVSTEQANTIRRLTTLLLSYKEAVGSNKALEDEIQKTNEATKAQLNLAAAYDVSYTAVRAAENINKAAPFEKQKNDLEETIAALQKMGATDAQLAPLQAALAQMKLRLDQVSSAINAQDLADQFTKSKQWGLQIRTNTQELNDQAAAILKGTAALHAYNIEQQVQKFKEQNPNLPQSAYDDRRKELQAQDVAGQKVTANTDSHALDLQITALKQYSQAVMAGTAALREFNVQQELTKFKEQNPNLSEGAYADELSQLRQKANLEALNAAADHVHSLERYKDIDDEINELQQLREQIIANGETTKAVDASIRDAKRARQDALADNRAETGGIGGGIEGGALKVQDEWRGSGMEAMNATVQAAHGMESAISSSFSQMIMGTKSVGQAFAEMGRNMLSSVVEACAQMLAKWIVTHVIMAAVAKMFGGGDGGDVGNASKKVAAAAVDVEADAAIASADVFVQAIENIPFPANLGAAPALAAVTHGEVTAIGAFEHGGIIPETGIALMHQDEGVLTKPAMNFFGDILSAHKNGSFLATPQMLAPPRSTWDGVPQMPMSFNPAINLSVLGGLPSSNTSNVRAGDTVHYYGGDQNFHNVSDPREAARLSRNMVMEELRSGGVMRRG